MAELKPISRKEAERPASEWDQEHWFDFSREPAMFHEDGIMTA
jgi:hypothetical protein